MNLIRCYIENFGVLHQYSLNFEEGMTTICQENGAGKSTLTMFLQAMFYGFPRGNKNLEKDLRRRYKPWQGGEYGGFLIFEVDGVSYRLERYFGDRPSQDSFTLYTLDPLRLSNAYDKDIGIALFGLDEESYARTSFIPQQMLGADLSSPGITAGLTTLVENTEDIHRYDHAMETLRQKRSGLLPYRGQGGKLARLQERLSQLQDSCYRLEQARQDLPVRLKEREEMEVKLADLQEELEQLQEEITQTNEGIWMKQLHDQYQRLSLESQRLSLAIQAMNLSYPRGFPEPEALEGTLDAIKDRDPSILSQDQDQLERLNHQLSLIERRYENDLPSQEELEAMQDSFHKMMECYDKLDDNHEQIEKDHSQYVERESNQKQLGMLVSSATLCLGVALIWFLLRYIIPGLVFLALGLVCLIAVHLNNQKQKLDVTEENSLLNEQAHLLACIHELEAQLEPKLLVYFAESSSGQYHLQLQQLAADRKTLEEGKEVAARLEEKIKQEREKIQAASNRIKVFCNQYSLPLSNLSYRSLMQMKEDHIRFLNLQEDYRKVNDQLSAFLLDHGSQVSREVKVDPRSLPILKERFRQKNQDQAKLQNQLAEEKQMIQQLKSKADQLPGILDQMTAIRESIEEAKKEVRYLDLAMKHLKEAREGLTESYLSQIKDAFAKYCSKLEDSAMDPDQCFLGTDLALSLDKQGAARALTAFSAGTADLYQFCMRLALVDALYPKNKPMLILDDPFVNLDEGHGQKALELLRSMEGQQILYLTCHQSRI